jgi:hypothetical protein
LPPPKRRWQESVALPPLLAFVADWDLTIHPDKYRCGPTALGVDFCSFV